jgi:hypothetical protein
MKRTVLAIFALITLACGGTDKGVTDPCDSEDYRRAHYQECVGAEEYQEHEADKREMAIEYNERRVSPDTPDEVRGCRLSSMYDISHVCSFVGFQNCVWEAQHTDGQGSAYEVVCQCVSDEEAKSLRDGGYCG